MIILRLLLLLTNLHLKLLSTQGTGADKLLITQRVNTKFWITNEKMFIKKSFLVMSIAFISTIVNYKLEKNIKNLKSQKSNFSDFYCLINTKFWITNKKMFIKKSLLLTFILSFLQL